MKVNLYAVAGGILLIAFIYATKAILLPFVFGFGVAYLLDPLADKLETLRFPRWLAIQDQRHCGEYMHGTAPAQRLDHLAQRRLTENCTAHTYGL